MPRPFQGREQRTFRFDPKVAAALRQRAALRHESNSETAEAILATAPAPPAGIDIPEPEEIREVVVLRLSPTVIKRLDEMADATSARSRNRVAEAILAAALLCRVTSKWAGQPERVEGEWMVPDEAVRLQFDRTRELTGQAGFVSVAVRPQGGK